MNIYALMNNQTATHLLVDNKFLNKSNNNDDNNDNNNNNNSWFNRVYLCYDDTCSPALAIKGFNCYRYNSFENADKAWHNDRKDLHKLNLRVTMIPICKWVPVILDKYILDWKLKKIYWLAKHKVNTGNTRYK